MKVFIAGPRAISSLDAEVKKRLSSIMEEGLTILVGDANGVDKAVQKYLDEKQYRNVIVYASNGIARNNIGFWPIENVPVEKGVSGFDYYTRKDAQMASDADYGFMIWNGKSKGTLNNMINLTKEKKHILVYLTSRKEFYHLSSMDTVKKLTKACGDETYALFTTLTKTDDVPIIDSAQLHVEQLSLFNLPLSNPTT